MIRTDALTKRFGDLTAVDRLSLDIPEGEVFGFLGPNGAGKTTTVRMLASLISKTSGSAEVAGCELGRAEDELKLRSRVGLLTENVGLYEGTSAYQNLDYFAALYRVEASARRASIERLLRMLGLWERRDAPVATFSKGMKQKVAIARALVHDPAVLFLDEPTANLDPEASKTVREFLLELKKERHTIFLTTHNLDEAQRVCDRVGVMRTGLLAVGAPDALKGRVGVRQTIVRLVAPSREVTEAVIARLAPRKVESDGPELRVEVSDPERENPEILEAVVAAGGRVRELSQASPTLEDVYLKLVHGAGGTAE